MIEKHDGDKSYTKFFYSVTGHMFEEPLGIVYTREWHGPEKEGEESYITHKADEF